VLGLGLGFGPGLGLGLGHGLGGLSGLGLGLGLGLGPGLQALSGFGKIASLLLRCIVLRPKSRHKTIAFFADDSPDESMSGVSS
jgi:hypothetical protein